MAFSIPDPLRRQISLAIPIISVLLFFGILESVLGIGLKENIADTGVTLSHVMGILSVILFWWIYKRRIS